MTEKFTEEQYRGIVNAWNKEDTYYDGVKSVIQYMLVQESGLRTNGDEALALANPLTREWAHDKFVEKEKKYYWRLKDNNNISLYSDGIIINIDFDKISKLTESEIKSWGYNPEAFDKEGA